MPKMPTIGDRIVEAFKSPDFPAPGIYGTPSERSPQTVGDMIIKQFVAAEEGPSPQERSEWLRKRGPVTDRSQLKGPGGKHLFSTIGNWLADKFNPGRKGQRAKDAYTTAVNNVMSSMPGRGYPPEYMQKLVNILARGYGEEPVDVSNWEQKGH